MKELFRSGIAKVLLLANLFFFGMTALSKAGKGIANIFGKVPLIGGGMKAVVNFIFKPFRAAAKFSKVVLIIDVILLVLLIVIAIIKKRQQKKATEELSEASTQKEKAKGFASMLKAFR